MVAASAPADAAPGPALRLGGFTPLTTIDFPGRLAAVFYCQGCPWRCGYCHNPELLDATAPPALPWERALAFLESRRGLLDGVVFSGGEPTLQAALPAALAEVRAMGFATGLHTGGMYPERLAGLLPLLDWVGLDIKGPLHCYDAITRATGSGVKAYESLRRLLASGVAHECRTTWHAGLFSQDELLELAAFLAGQGVKHWAVQECRTPEAGSADLAFLRSTRINRDFVSLTVRSF
ncbi:anaerobic ribonucleoside-triphosphate reductase activating protein [Acidovorax sp. Root70]|uniref:anaerobic ribonucleoside-triphosphate reductase activating protein n=1 Tax=Acidovorax sp. Root70 TaxID=1736590 RepID=UPI0006F8A7AD|nr:anaerobic ribonucleoside-triphosphate reductase activating protein [Acidovorax sp. Root70]KRB30397.1 anaerobic ribonucleoside-triphosphate reductase activating protein [Acidovorax sp. Root70]